MLTPGIYYPNHNAHRQLLNTLPGKNVYPVGSDFIYYSEGSVYYVNQMSTLPVDDVVSIYINGVLHGTAPILDTSGLYVYEFSPAYGTLEVKSVFSDSTEATQTFFCINLYTLIAAAADVWSEQRRANILLLANQYLTPQTTGLFRGQVDQEWMSKSFGEAIGFPQPSDWPFERYALAMGGYPALGLPGIYSALPKGSSVGAIKDIVQAVTGYAMSDEDFRQLQGVGWQLGMGYTGTYRFRYSGNPLSPVQDMDPTGASGPHYFLAYNQFETSLPYEALLTDPIYITVNGSPIPDSQFFARTEAGVTKVWISAVVLGDSVTITYTKVAGGSDTITVIVPQLVGLSPIANLQSNIQQAYTVMLNVVHDGFFVDGDSVLRNLVGTTDYLAYNWLNPWATIADYAITPLGWQHEGVTGSNHTLTIGATAQQGSELIAVNGNYLYPSQYAYTGPTTIEIAAGMTLSAESFVQVDYRTGGNVMSSYEVGVTGAAPYPYVVTLPAAPAPLSYGMSVFVNGSRLSNTQFTVLTNTVTITAQLEADDTVCVRFYTTGLNSYTEQTAIGQKREFVFTTAVDPASVLVMINGEHAPADAYTVPESTIVRLSDEVYNNTNSADITSVTADVGLPSGYSVKIVQGATVYVQGTHFEIDYTHGNVLWITGQPRPAAGSAYLVYYTYFPKQILEQLLRLVQPATMKVLLQFTTTLDQVFNPYFFEGVPNPSGIVIRPT